MDTINTIEFKEEQSQEDTSFHVEENSQEEQNSVDSIESMEEEASQEEEQSAAVDEEEPEELDMEQIPIGVDKLMSERNGKLKEGEQLVFTNPETDLPMQNINELDSQDLDDDADASFNPDKQPESPGKVLDEECEDSDRESVDGEDLDGVMIKVGTSDNNKLVFPNERNSMEQEEETTEEVPVVTEYIEEEDPDFNPAYCGETLSDCDENENGEEEQNPEVINLNGDGMILKVDPMMIPPPEEIDEEEVVAAEAPMDCE